MTWWELVMVVAILAVFGPILTMRIRQRRRKEREVATALAPQHGFVLDPAPLVQRLPADFSIVQVIGIRNAMSHPAHPDELGFDLTVRVRSVPERVGAISRGSASMPNLAFAHKHNASAALLSAPRVQIGDRDLDKHWRITSDDPAAVHTLCDAITTAWLSTFRERFRVTELEVRDGWLLAVRSLATTEDIPQMMEVVRAFRGHVERTMRRG